jgi:hypothetical protein
MNLKFNLFALPPLYFAALIVVKYAHKWKRTKNLDRKTKGRFALRYGIGSLPVSGLRSLSLSLLLCC